jgi:predicted metal-dependent phosphoesterase TrpH
MRRLTLLVMLAATILFTACQTESETTTDPATEDTKTALNADSSSTGAEETPVVRDELVQEEQEPYEPGWYKGDLHSHSLYSDGDSPLCDVLNIAEGKNFDYFVLTEHDTAEHWLDALYTSKKMTLLYGVEWTTDKGHANVWSDRPYDWDALKKTLGDANAAINMAHSMAADGQEILFSINHPSAPTCAWKYSYEESAGADSMEVWNARFLIPNLNFKSVNGLYQEWTGKGRKMAMVGGSDAHEHQPGFQTIYNDVGHPTTWVYAQNRTAKGILRAIRQGHTLISTSPEGPFVEFLADASYDPQKPQHVDYDVMIGDSIPEKAWGKDVFFMTRIKGATVPSGVLVVKNGMPFKFALNLSSDYCVSFTDKPQKGDYYRVELRQIGTKNPTNPLGELLQGFIAAITSPIYAF